MFDNIGGGVICQHMRKRKSAMYERKKSKLILDVGDNDADYAISHTTNGKQVMCPFYRVWKSMLERCYSSTFHNRNQTYKDCTVCDEWLSFMAFRAWMVKQDWKGNQLDKDILVAGNKNYSPKTCIFVTAEVNNLLLPRLKSRGKYPIGVCRVGVLFKASLRTNGDIKYLGYYTTPATASCAYNVAKAKHIRKIAHDQTDPRVSSGLLRHADLYANGLVQ